MTHLTLQATDDTPVILDCLFDPDLRQVSTFILGWVFMCSTQYILCSSSLCNILRKFRGFISRQNSIVRVSDIETAQVQEKKGVGGSKKVNLHQTHVKDENRVLALILSLSFALASLGHFLSLLTYGASTADGSCAFLVAWADLTSHSGRLLGLYILRHHLKQLGIKFWEALAFVLWLLIAIAFLFFTNAISIGTTRFISELGVTVCQRKQFLPINLTSSLIYIVIELYTLCRLISLLLPRVDGSCLKLQPSSLADARVAKAISLLALDLLTIARVAIFRDNLIDFIPFGVGALFVVVAFNQHMPASAVPYKPAPTPTPQSFFRRSMMGMRPSVVPSTAPVLPPIYFANHPFSAYMPQLRASHDWSVSRSRRARSMDSLSSDSVRHAISQRTLRRISSGIVEVARTREGSSRTSVVAVENIDTESGVSSHKASTPASRRDMISRQILPSQTKYAERFENEAQPGPVPRPGRPHISIVISETESAERISPRGNGSRTSPSSVYGSDIIRPTPKRKRDVTKFWSLSSFQSRISNATTASPRDSLAASPGDARSLRHFSMMSARKVSGEELSVVYENVEGSQTWDANPSRGNRRTFGEQSLFRPGSRRLSRLPSPGVNGIPDLPPRPGIPSLLLSPPVELDSSQRGFRSLRGPRAPPTSASATHGATEGATEQESPSSDGVLEVKKHQRSRSDSSPGYIERSQST